MLKKCMTFLGAVVLICFSFYYTDSAVDIVKRNDPIMREIIDVSTSYEKLAIDAILIDNGIIPGVKGEMVDIDKSYSNMKRYGEFNESLLIFKEVIPSISVTNNYDNYIIKGNSNKKEVSLIFNLSNTSYMEDIIRMLNEKNTTATFFIDSSLMNDSLDAIRLLAVNNFDIQFLGDNNTYTKDNLNRAKRFIKAINSKEINYCLSEKENEKLLNLCKESKLYTLIPNINTDKYPYSDVKNNLDNGSIIKLNNNTQVLRELSSIINYIYQKGYKIVSLNDLLAE